MAVRKLLEDLLSVNNGSGYCFVFSLKHLSFFTECEEAVNKLSRLLPNMKDEKSLSTINETIACLVKIRGNATIKKAANELKSINSIIFMKVRNVFMVTRTRDLFDGRYTPKMDDPIGHEDCTALFKQLEVYPHVRINSHMFIAAKIAIERYKRMGNTVCSN